MLYIEISRIASITQQVIVCGATTFFDRHDIDRHDIDTHDIDRHFSDEDVLDSLINETSFSLIIKQDRF